MTESVAGQITGDDIISELIRNADAGCFKVRYTILVPCIFNVYLHPRDHELIQPIVELIREEAVRALQEHLSRSEQTPRCTSASPSASALAGEPRPEYKILEKQWSIQFHADQEERLRPAEIEIYSELGSARPKDFGAGAMTTLITRNNAARLGDRRRPAAIVADRKAGSRQAALSGFWKGQHLRDDQRRDCDWTWREGCLGGSEARRSCGCFARALPHSTRSENRDVFHQGP